MLCKNRKWCHDLKIAYGVKGILVANVYIQNKSNSFPDSQDLIWFLICLCSKE